jgi:Flp pilus assembly protein TadG
MKSDKGQSLVEFALIVPVLLLLLLGIMDFARIFHAYLTIDHAGREAAREASIGKVEPAITEKAVEQGASIGLKTANVHVSPGSPGTNATITIEYPITFLTPMVGNIVGPLTLKDTTIMRVEK